MTTEPENFTPRSSGENAHNDIFNSLRIPDAIKDLPKFDGNPRLLHEFINNVEEILLHIRGADGTPYGQILLRAVRNKITGEANEILNMYGTALHWDDIKGNLILHYSDKRTETSLIRDLHGLRQDNRTVEAFYSQVMEIQSALCNNILIHENDQNVIRAKKELFAEMCLNSFLTNLREPLGASIRAMRPESLATALSFCIKEQNIFYGQVKNRRDFYQRSQPQSNYQNNKPNYVRNTYHPYTKPQQNYNGTNQGQFEGQRPTFNTSGISQKPQFNDTFRNQKPTFNNSRMNSSYGRFPQDKPVPMDTSTTFSRYGKPPSNPFKQSPSTQTRTSSNSRMELNNIVNYPETSSLQDNYEILTSENFQTDRYAHPSGNYQMENFQDLDRFQDEITNIEDEQDFRASASTNQQDI